MNLFRLSLTFLLLFCLSCEKQPEPGAPGQTEQSLDNANRDSTDSPDSTELHIQSIRNDYKAAMALPLKSYERNCDDGALVTTVDVRWKDGKVVWIRYSAGYDHGVQSHEALLSNEEIVFIMKEERTWNFDPEVPPSDSGESHTVDQATQNRYYYMDGSMIRALYKSVTARSIQKESLEDKLREAKNLEHPTPDAGEAIQKVRSILSSFESTGGKSAWCE